MILHLVRHAKAERQSASGRDEDRLLKDRGVKQAAWLGEQIASELKDREREDIRLLVSGVARAWQTGGPIGEALGMAPEREPLLETGRSAAEVLRVIDRERGARALILVGHDPHFSEALRALARGDERAETGLRTGQSARFTTVDGALVLDRLLRSDD